MPTIGIAFIVRRSMRFGAATGAAVLTTFKQTTTKAPAPTIADVPVPKTLVQLRDPQSIRVEGVPLVTIITVVRDDEQGLQRTIESIRTQTYRGIEHMVIDMQSSDRTRELIQSPTGLVSAYISERVSNFFDAVNKGIVSAHGEVIGVLESGEWLEPDFVEQAMHALTESAGDFVFGDICKHHSPEADEQGVVVEGNPDYQRVILHDSPRIGLSGMLCRKFVYDRIGVFRTDMQCASHYDFQIRAHQAGFQGVHASGAMVHTSSDEQSKKERHRQIKESFACSVRHGHPVYKAIPQWSMRWIVNQYPGVGKYQIASLSSMQSLRSATARGAKRTWDVFGPLKPYLPGKKLAMKVLGVSPLDHQVPAPSAAQHAAQAPASVSVQSETTSQSLSDSASAIEAKPVVAQDVSKHIQGNTQLYAFIEARHAGLHLSDRTIEAMIQRAEGWDWFMIRGEHQSAPAFEALFAGMGVKRIDHGSDESTHGLVIDFHQQRVMDHQENDAVMILDEIPPEAVKLGDQGMCLIRGAALSAAR